MEDKAMSVKVTEPAEISRMTSSVIETDQKARQANSELGLLNDAMCQLDKTLEEHKELSAKVRRNMQRLMPKMY